LVLDRGKYVKLLDEVRRRFPHHIIEFVCKLNKCKLN
jgi:hypothetical protein